MIDRWSADWSTPVFSLEERDRRWAKVRALMAREGMDVLVCMPCTNSHNRGQADPVYLTQLGENEDEVCVVFPIEGEVTAWLSREGVWPASNWLTDIRQAPRGTGGSTVVNRLKEMGFSAGTIGIAGLTGGLLAHVRETEGEVNWQSVEIVKQAFPSARLVSATNLLGEARFQKSEAELEFIRKGAEIAEKVIDTISKYARAGVREREVYGQMLHAYAVEGGSFQPMVGWISGRLGKTYHRLEVPSFRTLQLGDIIATEIEGRWGGYIAQLDQQFCIGPAPQDLKDGMKLTLECYDRAIELMRPEVTVGEVLDRAGTLKGMNGRGVARLIFHGRGTGDDGPLVTTRITPQLRAVQLKEGCTLIVKPSAYVDGKSDFGHWGESVVVRRDGVERLGKRRHELPELV